MEEVLRQRLLRRIESLPEAQVYQVLDYVEFLESKYSRTPQVAPSVLQKFAEGVQDTMRRKAMNPAKLREAFQLIAAADRVLADVATAGKQILDELGTLSESPPPRRRVPPSTSDGPGESAGHHGTRAPDPPGPDAGPAAHAGESGDLDRTGAEGEPSREDGAGEDGTLRREPGEAGS